MDFEVYTGPCGMSHGEQANNTYYLKDILRINT